MDIDFGDASSGESQFLRGLLGALGGVASRHKAGNILMSGLRGGMLGAREGVQDDGIEEGGGYLEALLNVPAGWGYSAQQAVPQAGNPLQESFGGPGSALGYLGVPGGPLAAQAMQMAQGGFSPMPQPVAPQAAPEGPAAVFIPREGMGTAAASGGLLIPHSSETEEPYLTQEQLAKHEAAVENLLGRRRRSSR